MPAITPTSTASLTRDEYNALPGLSYSGIKELLRSPAHYQLYLKAEREETKALRIGSAAHLGFLLPAKFTETYAQAPECDRRTKDGKALYQHALDSLKPGQLLLPHEEYEEVIRLIDAANALVDGDLLRTNAWAETPLVGRDKNTPIKGIPDLITQDGWIYDLKTCEDASESGFLRAILNYKYHVQAAHYIRLAHCNRNDIQGFRLIAIEKESYQGAVYEIRGEVLDLGNKLLEQAYSTYDRCVAEDSWPGYHSGVTVLDTLPGSKKASTSGVGMTF